MRKNFTRLKNSNDKGFSLVEIVVIIAIMVVLLAVLTPSILRYTENSRMQKDDSALDELCNSVQLALADATTFDEAFSYSIANNYVTYTDSSGIYSTKIVDEEFWAPDGSGHAVTITWNPDENGNYTIANGLVNDMTYGNGSVADSRVSDNLQQCYLSEMGTGKLYHQVEQTFGATFSEKSATYKNSSYTVFIRFNLMDGIYRADVYGEWNGTNLSPDCPASLGSGTSSYTEDKEPEQTKAGGTTQSNYTSSDLQGGGGGNPPTYKQFLPCGHLYGTAGDHTQQGCGHYACEECECMPAACGVEGHYEGDGQDHSQASCGHFNCQCTGCIIPEGGKYTTVDGTIYRPGDKFPEIVNTGDAYVFGDYEYRYNQWRNGSGNNWQPITGHEGWCADVINSNKSSYGPILEQIANKPVASLQGTFQMCKNLLTAPEIPQYVTNMHDAFIWCEKLTVAPQIPDGVIDMRGAFYYCYELTVPPVIPDSVTNLQWTFRECKALQNAPAIPKNVVNMSGTFTGCPALINAPDMSNAINVQQMDRAFWGCSALEVGPDMSNCHNVTDMTECFKSCSSLKTIPAMPSSVVTMEQAFYQCTALQSAPDLSVCNQLTSMKRTFYGCTSLQNITIIPQSVTEMYSTFENCSSLTGVITIDANPTSYAVCLRNVDMSTITLKGISSMKRTLASTGSNSGRVTIID